MPSNEVVRLRELTEKLLDDYRATQNLAGILAAAIGKDEADRALFRASMPSGPISWTHQALISNLIFSVILGIGRLTDPSGKDRISVHRINFLLNDPVLEEIRNDWQKWGAEKLLDHCQSSKHLDTFESKLAAFQAGVKRVTATASDPIRRIRAFRNIEIAHSLDLDTPDVSLNDIQSALHGVGAVVLGAAFLFLSLEESHPGKWAELYEQRARKYWDALHAGFSAAARKT